MELLDGYKSPIEMFCHDNPSGHYRQLYFEIINIFVRSLKERFEQESFEHYAKMESVLLPAINGEELFEEGIALLRNEYNDDLDIDMLVTELPVLKTFFKDIEIVCFDDIIKHFRNFPTETKIIPNVALVVMLLVNPSTSASAERSFSLSRRLETWQRSTMKQKRYNSLAILQDTQREN